MFGDVNAKVLYLAWPAEADGEVKIAATNYDSMFSGLNFTSMELGDVNGNT